MSNDNKPPLPDISNQLYDPMRKPLRADYSFWIASNTVRKDSKSKAGEPSNVQNPSALEI